ncbi:hypothetical protein AAF712_015336 [Marasmius tenuissimus]|uniref:DUF6535 domain-containing protein n=1 Tax=Marasmius tenuissimus TaxID=585030 RepID=A0ABR2Z9H4_9AGAR
MPPKGKKKQRDQGAVRESWEELTSTIGTYDDEMVNSWKEEIDTLLVFAGLFSAVVTAFTVESFKSLSEDPSETTVTLLRQISQQIAASANGTGTTPEQPSSKFEPSRSDIRINTFWIVSLILSLTCSLFGLLCKQWFRHHQRAIPTRSRREAFTLRWVRNQSLKRWHVPSIVAMLPLLIELALLLFFVGLLELVWMRHAIPFAFGLVVVGVAAVVFGATSVLPAVTVLRALWSSKHGVGGQGNQPEDIIANLPPVDFPCPYKSPQAWFVLKAIQTVMRLPLLSKRRATLETEQWSFVDLLTLRKYDRYQIGNLNAPQVYKLLGLRWMVRLYGHSPSVGDHLRNTFGELQKSMAISSVLDDWKVLTWGGSTKEEDVLARLDEILAEGDMEAKGELDGDGGNDAEQHAPPQKLTLQLLYYYKLWILPQPSITFEGKRKVTERLYDMDFPKKVGTPFLPPFPEVSKLWREPPKSEEWNTGLKFLKFYRLGWKIAKSLESGDGDTSSRRTLVEALTDHLLDESPSALAMPDDGLDFLSFINEEIVSGRKGEDEEWRKTGVLSKWTEALQRVRAFRDEGYFREIPFSMVNVGGSGAENEV